MDYDEASDLAEEIEFTLSGQDRIDALRAHADQLDVGEVGRAVFLMQMAECFEMDGQLDGARGAYVACLDDGGPTWLNPLAGLVSVELKDQRTERADELLTDLLALSRADGLREADYEWIGESLELAGQLKQAHRWFTIPLRGLDPDLDLELLPIVALNGRFRVRRELGLPVDAYDLAVEPARQMYAERRELDLDEFDQD